MVTADNVDIDWPYSYAVKTSLTAEKVKALLSRDACERALAHADLTYGQVNALYDKTTHLKKCGRRRRVLGRRIRASGLAEYCGGIGENRLIRIFAENGPYQTKEEKIKALMALS